MFKNVRWVKEPKGLEIRHTTEKDGDDINRWLQDPQIQKWFPVKTQEEIDFTVHAWTEYAKYGCALTATILGEVAGSAVLYLQPYKRMAHQCLFAIIVDEKFRGQGAGTKLLSSLFSMAKKRFSLQMLHLEVYRGNPAVSLYERLGFKHCGVREKFLKDGDEYFDQIIMQKTL